jgi:secondary thiamine-phosphate synthase enzyme
VSVFCFEFSNDLILIISLTGRYFMNLPARPKIRAPVLPEGRLLARILGHQQDLVSIVETTALLHIASLNYTSFLMVQRIHLISLLLLLPAIVTAFLFQTVTPSTCIALFSKTSIFSATNSEQVMSIPRWYQRKISITAPSRGCHLITSEVNKAIKDEMATINIGMANFFIQHTSASLTVNENADPDVRRDMETALNKIAPESWNRDGTFKHTAEGDDDMPGHLKSSLMGVSLNIPISNGRLALG